MTRLLRSTTAGVLLVLALEVAVFSILSPHFLSAANVRDTLLTMSFIGLLALGQSVVILSGGIDLSVGSLLGLSNVVAAWLLSPDFGHAPWPAAPGVAAGILAGTAGGLLNGLLVAGLRIPPFIATLGMLSAARGVAYWLSGGLPIQRLAEPFGRPDLTALPLLPGLALYLPTVAVLVATLLLETTLRRTRTGRHLYALGGSEAAARLSGLPVGRTKLLAYGLSGLLAGVAGTLTLFQYGAGDSRAGVGFELDAVAACVIGGVSLAGGVGNAVGPLVGALITASLQSGLIMVRVEPQLVHIATGVVIVAAVALERWRRRGG